MSFNYRIVKPNESSKYRDIRLESLRLYSDRFFSIFEEQQLKPKLSFELFIEKELPRKFVFGCFDEDKLIGICGFYIPENSRFGEIIQMYVKKKYQGKGHGQGLLDGVIEIAFGIDTVDEIQLGVITDASSVIQLYNKTGFINNGVDKINGTIEEQKMVLTRKQYFTYKHLNN
ncbi:MAG: GNAT family N-acetyltransferase [Flavobacteriales bacterium]|nr:GNAT family N-acetyltransferase [Flavobacteriales bacterium]